MATTQALSHQATKQQKVAKPVVDNDWATALGWLLIALSLALFCAGTYQVLAKDQPWGWALVGAFGALGCLGGFELLVAYEMHPQRGYATEARHIWSHRLTKLALWLSVATWIPLILLVEW